ncbi:MAG: hypothetical protein RL748_4539, partial [Pseudomonadota bacterium]
TATLALSACQSLPGTQIHYFSQAFNSVNTVSQPLLDDLALAERNQGQAIAMRRAQGKSHSGVERCPPAQFAWQLAADGKQGFINGFCNSDAVYFSTLDDPPFTASMRASLAAIEAYANLLTTLANGSNIDNAVGQIKVIGHSIEGLSPSGLAAAGTLDAAIVALSPLLKSLAQQSNAAEARQIILAGAPKIDALIQALHTSAPVLFNDLIEASSQRLSREANSADLDRISSYRVAVANYLVLLDKLGKAWRMTVDAAQTPGQSSNLAALARYSAELKADADAVRKTFAVLRNGGNLSSAQNPKPLNGVNK